ncbi:cobalt-precorrin-5B (C(1))-methyltransferase [Albimonas sp. CAU 1670]|uniref:cobalt-precorrin-5B (C(1))-methyltransferase n=1 Tax=Albimonas sp. CAU 1670 TaxID=3032599 RepID=UPI0023DA1F27|nr:cobalt-precorrin-5B (C(1))-methyltransferase [Albimonas sp. CAU 1670]MDF2233885.1 cobalt-precorrin-5B (C(1))-methyltransferase [Albimonas sp. CAU 1670]
MAVDPPQDGDPDAAPGPAAGEGAASGGEAAGPDADAAARAGRTGGAGLRTGFTTGACATAAAKAAWRALLGGGWEDPSAIVLPRGARVGFALERRALSDGLACAAVRKDAGDDPDVTHGAIIEARVRRGAPGAGVTFRAGPGVGTVTRPGLPIPPGEPAINPVPRRMIEEAIAEVSAELAEAPDAEVEISIPGGEALAQKTWNPRLGIVGGLSILGTTGIVRPYSCAAWIASIHRGVDVARAAGLSHVVGSTGSSSEAAARARFDLPVHACLDMGDFAGGLLKYLARHPVARLTIAGGAAKLAKLGQGAMDLHSSRSQVDFARLAALAEAAGVPEAGRIAQANTVLQALQEAGAAAPALAEAIGREAARVAQAALGEAPVAVDVLVCDRAGAPLAFVEAQR